MKVKEGRQWTLPALPMGDFIERFALRRLEIIAGKVGDREQGCLGDGWRDAEQGCNLCFIGQMHCCLDGPQAA